MTYRRLRRFPKLDEDGCNCGGTGIADVRVASAADVDPVLVPCSCGRTAPFVLLEMVIPAEADGFPGDRAKSLWAVRRHRYFWLAWLHQNWRYVWWLLAASPPGWQAEFYIHAVQYAPEEESKS